MEKINSLLRGAGLVVVLLAHHGHGSDTLDAWQWRHPLPSGNFSSRISHLNGQFVVLNSGPALLSSHDLLTSLDGTNWVSRLMPVKGTLKQMAYGNGRYVVVGGGTNGGSISATNGGLVASSSDLTTWTISDSGTLHPLNAVAFGGGMFAAVGSVGSVPSNTYAGFLITSSDGMIWTLRSSPPNSPINDIVYGNGMFVAAHGGNVLISSDGISWNSVAITNSGTVQWLSFAQGKFFAAGYRFIGSVSSPTLFGSGDGLNWTPVTSPRESGNEAFRVVSGNSLLLGVRGTSSGSLSISTNGNDFTTIPTINYLPSDIHLTYGNGLLVNTSLQTSSDGTNWSPTALSPTNAGSFNLQDMFFGTNGYVALGTSQMLASSNGLKFAPVTNSLPAVASRIASANGLFHGAGSGGIIRSTNGLNWEPRNAATTQALYDIDYGNSTWVAVGASGTITTSSTGNAWSLRTSGTALGLYGLVYASNLFVAVGQSGTVLTSLDGTIWTPQYSGTLERLNKITYGNGQFIAVGQHGAVITSPDGINWAVQTSGTGGELTGIAFGDGAFCAIGSGSVLTSVNGSTWASRLTSSDASSVRFLNGTFFIFSGGNILQSGPVSPVELQTVWNGNFPQITIQGAANLLLRLQSADDLTSSAWTDRGLITNSTNGVSIFQDASTAGQASRFYRVVAP